MQWHTRTPNAPLNQGNTWVIQRTMPGTSNGVRSRTEILSGNQWVSKQTWQDAINARANGTATPEKIKILDEGHWKE